MHWIESAQVCGFRALAIIRCFPGGSTWPLSIRRLTSYLILQTSNQLSQSADLSLKSFLFHLHSSCQRQRGTMHHLQIASAMFYSSRHLKPHLRVAVIAMWQSESNVQALLLSSIYYKDYNGYLHFFANCFEFLHIKRCSLGQMSHKKSTEKYYYVFLELSCRITIWWHGTITANDKYSIVFHRKTKM